MSGQYGQKKKQPRGGPSGGNYPLRPRPTKNQEKSVLSEGIYKNELFMFNALSVIGSTVKIWVNNGRIYEGIFRTFNAGLEMVVDNVHLVEGSKLPCKENIIPHMVFQWKDIVNMNLPDVNLDYAILGTGGDGCVDASTSGRHNGRSGERELQPWVNTDEFSSELETLDESNSNGWPANSMFEANETKFNYISTYDPTLKEYTTELPRADTEEYRAREAEAKRHAQEIESSSTYSDNADLENGDEEMLFSAVHRPDETGAAVTTAGNGGKYILPQHRNAAQAGTTLAHRTQKVAVLPSTQTEAVRSHHPSPAIVPTAAMETAAAAAAISSSSGVIRINAGEARKEEIDRPLAPNTKPAALGPAAAFEHMTDKPKISSANVPSTNNVKTEPPRPRADAIQELKKFQEIFKLEDAASEPKEPMHPVSEPLLASQTVALAPSLAAPVALPQSQLPPHTQVASHQQMVLEPSHRGFQEERSEAKEDVKEDVSKKSVLNPSAKEFVPAVKTYQAPRNLPSQTPPRPPSTVGSPVFMPYIQQNTPVYHTTIMPPPANIQQSRSAGVANKRASVSVSARPDINPPPQAMTGAPLITQQVMISGPAVVPGGLTMMPVHQPVLRMLPQHHQNVMIDPNQPVFAVPMASSLTSHQPPHPGAALGPATHHMIAGGALTGAMHASHGAVAPPPQQTSGAPTPTPVHQYGQPPQPGSAMALPTTSGTPQSPAQIQMFPGAPGGPLAMSHPQQMHPVSLQHINNPTSPIIYQTPGGGLVQFPGHQAPGLAYAAAGPGGQQPGQGQTPMAGPHQQPPPAMGPSSHVIMHGPQMVMGPQGHGTYVGMPVPGAMTQTPGFAQHPVAAFHMYSVPGAGPTFSFTP